MFFVLANVQCVTFIYGLLVGFLCSPDEAVFSSVLVGIAGDGGFNLACQLVGKLRGKLFLFEAFPLDRHNV